MGDRIAAMTPTRQYLELPIASPIWALLTLLFFPGFVANMRPQMDSGAQLFIYNASLIANHDTQTRLLQDVNVVIVCVAHRPTWCVASGLLIVSSIDAPTMTVGPFVEIIPSRDLRYWVVIDVPSGRVHNLVMSDGGIDVRSWQLDGHGFVVLTWIEVFVCNHFVRASLSLGSISALVSI